MSPELDAALCRLAPNLYRDRYGSPRETLLCWGFPGDGWFELLARLSVQLEPVGVTAVQVKEKYGGLRFYLSECDEGAEALIRAAEAEAERTCEACGHPGRLTRRWGWFATRCPACTSEGAVVVGEDA